MPTLTLFYDGHCPLCVKEMNKLKGYDTHHQLLLVDTHSSMFDDYPDIDSHKASKVRLLSPSDAADEERGVEPRGNLITTSQDE